MSNFDDLWCQECGKSHEGVCRKHGALHKVQDTVIPSRAKLTLPQSLTLKTIKENGAVYSGVFSKKTIPVRSQFGPLDAPVISKMKIESKPKAAITIWKKKHAMQKALETSALSHNSVSDTSDVIEHNGDNLSPIITNIKSLSAQPLQTKGVNCNGASAEVAISSIQQQLMSITSQSISQSGAADAAIIGLQSLQQPLHSSPINGNQTNLSHFQHSLQDLPAISFQTGPTATIQLSHENLQSLQQHYQTFSQQPEQDLASFQTNLNINDPASANQMAMLNAIVPAFEVENQSVEDSGVVDPAHQNVSDSTDVTSDTELDDTAEPDMSFELKIVTEDGFTETLDTADEEHSNWMIFVRPAKSVKEQNLIAYQEDGNIFFVSLRPISANTELRVWYSKDYAKSIGKGMIIIPEDHLKQGDEGLQCVMCEVRFPDQDEMDNHLCVGKLKGRRKGRPRKYVKPTKTWRAKLEKSRIKESHNQQVAKEGKGDAVKSKGSLVPTTPKRGRPRVKAAATKVTPVKEPLKIEIIDTAPDPVPEQQEMTVQFEVTQHFIQMDDAPEEEFEVYPAMDDEEDRDPLYTLPDTENRLAITEEKVRKKKRGPKSTRTPLICRHCGLMFVAEAAYYVHVYKHTGIKPFICEYGDCGRGFLSKFKLQRHCLIHTAPRDHKCPYCDKSFNRKDHLKNHMITHDPNKKIWKCELCAKEYCYSFSYRAHMAFHQAESGETLACGICKNEFENKEQLLFHLKAHTGARAAKNSTEKTHPCFECGKKFFTRKDVKRHMITHTKKKDYLCQFCPQRFGRKDHLTRHLRTSHTGDNANRDVVRERADTGDSGSGGTPGKVKQHIYCSNPTMVPVPMTLPTVQQDDLHEQLINDVTAATQNSSNTAATQQATLLQNIQYAMSQLPGQIQQGPTALYEVATAAAQEQQQQAQVTPINTLQSPTGMQTIQANIPVQYQINDKSYVMNAQPAEHQQPAQQPIVRHIHLSPSIDYNKITQQIQGNMYIATGNNTVTQIQPQQQQPVHQQQTVQQIPIQIQQQIQSDSLQQASTVIGKLEPVELTRSNNIVMQQPPEYQLSATAIPGGIVQSVPNGQGQDRTSLVMTGTVDGKQPNEHSQAYSTLMGYIETLRFLENLPTNNTTTIPVQQLQTLNVDISQTQAQTAQLIPASYNTVAAASGANIININQADLAKGVVQISHPHGTLQLTPQELKNVVSLAQQSATPVQQLTYQQQPS